MNKVFNYDLGKYEFVSGEMVKKGLETGKYGLDTQDTVFLNTPDGQTLEFNGAEAIRYLSDPLSGFSYSSYEDRRAEKLRDDALEQPFRTAVEGVARGFTGGLSDMALKNILEVDPEQIKAREEAYPALSTLTEIAGFIAPFPLSKLSAGFGVAGAVPLLATKAGEYVGKNAANLATRFLGKKVPNNLIKYGGEAATEGAILSALHNVKEADLGNEELNAESLLMNVSSDAILAGSLGGIAGTGIVKGMKAISGARAAISKKFNIALEEGGANSFEKVSSDFLKRSDNKYRGFNHDYDSIVKLKAHAGPKESVRYADRSKEIYVNRSELKGVLKILGEESRDEINSYGVQLGIANLYDKILTKSSGFDLDMFLSSSSLNMLKTDFAKAHKQFLSLQNKKKSLFKGYNRLRSEKNKIFESVENIADLSSSKKLRLKTIDKKISTLLKGSRRLSNEQKMIINKNVPSYSKKIDDLKAKLKQYDGVEVKSKFFPDQTNIHIFNIKKLDDLGLIAIRRGAKRGNLDSLNKRFLEILKPTKYFLASNPIRKQMAAAQYIRDTLDIGKGGNTLVNLARNIRQGHNAIDIVARQAIDDINSYGSKIGESITLLTNKLRENKLSTGITYRKIKDYINKRVISELGPSKDIRKFPDIKSDFEWMQKYVDVLDVDLDKEVSIDMLKELSIMHGREGSHAKKIIDRDLRIKFHQMMREFLESNLEKSMKKFEDFHPILKDYKRNKSMYEKAVTADELIFNIVSKSKEASNLKQVMGYLMPPSIGGYVGHSFLGIPGMIGAAYGTQYMSQASPYLKAVYINKIFGDKTAITGKVKRSVKTFLEKTSSRTKTILGGDASSILFKAGVSQVPQMEYRNHLEILSGSDNDQQKINNDFNEKNPDFNTFAPNTGLKLNEKFVKLRNMLYDNIPTPIGVPEVNGSTPSVTQMSKYNAYKTIILNPQKIFDQLNEGFITYEAAQVLKNVFPSVHNLMFHEFMSNSKNVNFSPSQKMELKKLFGGSLDATTSTRGMTMLQSLFQINGEQADAKMIGNMQRRGFRGKPDERNQTNSQRLLTR